MSKGSAIEIVGGEIIGEKAGMLKEHERLIAEVGLQIPPTTVIASEALEPFRVKIEEGKEVRAEELGELATRAAATLEDNLVLAIRSSAEGDARGTGIYDSDFRGNDVESMQDSMLKLLRNFARRGALDFREQAHLGENFAIMIQPVVGQFLDLNDDSGYVRIFGPPISGYGYSQTRFEPDGILNVVAGLGGGVDRRGGEKIQPSDIEKSAKLLNPHSPEGKPEVTLIDYLTTPLVGGDVFRLIPGGTDFRGRRRDLKLSGINSLGIGITFDEKVTLRQRFFQELPNYIEYDTQRYKKVENPADESPALETALELFKPIDIFEAMHKMQEIAGYPLYIEWAASVNEGELKPVVVQIAPFEIKKAGQIEAEIPKKILIMGEDVEGHGVENATKIVLCNSTGAIADLAKFNANPDNKGYVLVYPGNITGGADNRKKLSFDHMSNASVVIEAYSGDHAQGGGRYDHLSGAMDLSGKFFASWDHALKDYGELGDLSIYEGKSISNGLNLIEGDFKIIADQTQNRIIIGTD